MKIGQKSQVLKPGAAVRTHLFPNTFDVVPIKFPFGKVSPPKGNSKGGLACYAILKTTTMLIL